MFKSDKEIKQIENEIKDVLVRHDVTIGQAILIHYNMAKALDLLSPSEYRCIKCKKLIR